MCQRCVAKFNDEDVLHNNAPQSRRPFEIDSEQSKTVFENNQYYKMPEITNIFKISTSSIVAYLRSSIFFPFFSDEVQYQKV